MTDKLLGDGFRIPDDGYNVDGDGQLFRKVSADGVIYWEVSIGRQWDFEEGVGLDFVDSINQEVMSNTDMASTGALFTPFTVELSNSLQIQAETERVTSKPYGYHYIEGIQPEVELGSNYFETQSWREGITQDISFGNFELKDVLITYNDGDPEGSEITDVTLGNFDMKVVLLTYNDGDPEGLDITNVTLGDFDMKVVLVEYNNGDPEGISVSDVTLGDFDLS